MKIYLLANASKIDPIIKKHNNYRKSDIQINVNLKKDGILSYRFNLPEDSEAEIYLTIMVFNIPNL